MMSDDLKKLQQQVDEVMATLSRLNGQEPVMLFGAFALGYLSTKLNNPSLRSSTKASFRTQVVSHLIPAFGELALVRITDEVWLEWCRSSKLGRFFNTRKALKEILLAAKSARHIENVPLLTNPDLPTDVGRVLSDREIFSILKGCPNRFFRFFFYVLFKTGCRPREVLKWEWSMIAWNEPGHSWIAIPARISKTNRSRKIPLNPSISRRLYRMSRSSTFIWPNPKNPLKPQMSYHGAWNAACGKAGLEAVPYDLRRTFITRCAAAGMPLLYVAKLLDTSTKMIESVYAKSQIQVMEDIVK